MNTRLLTFFMLFTLLIFAVPAVVSAETKASSKAIATPNQGLKTTEAPSDTYLRSEMKSEAASTKLSAFSDSYKSVQAAGQLRSGWDDLGEGGGSIGGGNNMGAPLSGAALPIAMSLLVLYLLYRRFSITRKRNSEI